MQQTHILSEGSSKTYGSTRNGYQNGGYSGTVFEGNIREDSLSVSTHKVSKYEKHLDVKNVSYVVKEWVGPWWKGACLRKTRRKRVLNDVSIRLTSGEITAILGNSGGYYFFAQHFFCHYVFNPISIYFRTFRNQQGN